MVDMRTPLRKVRGLGSARDGTGDFWHQRLTALSSIPLLIFFLVLVIALTGSTYEEVRETLANPFIALVLAFMLISILYHMKIGMQIIIEDYVHEEGTKIVLLALNIFFPIVLGVLSLAALFKIVLGG